MVPKLCAAERRSLVVMPFSIVSGLNVVAIFQQLLSEHRYKCGFGIREKPGGKLNGTVGSHGLLHLHGNVSHGS